MVRRVTAVVVGLAGAAACTSFGSAGDEPPGPDAAAAADAVANADASAPDGLVEGAPPFDAASGQPFCPRPDVVFCVDFDDPTKASSPFGFTTAVLNNEGTMALVSSPSVAGKALRVGYQATSNKGHAHLDQSFTGLRPLRVELDAYLDPLADIQTNSSFAIVGMSYGDDANGSFLDVYVTRGADASHGTLFAYGEYGQMANRTNFTIGDSQPHPIPFRKWVHVVLEVNSAGIALGLDGAVVINDARQLATNATPATTAGLVGVQRYNNATPALAVLYDDVTMAFK